MKARSNGAARGCGRRPLVITVVLAFVLAAVFGGASPASAAPGPAAAPEWWFDTWNVPALWAAGANGSGITIAEIDTGVNGAIPAIAGNLVPGIDFGSAGGNGWIDRETSLFGHGTAMASLIVATKGAQGVTGLAPNATLLPVALPINGTDDAAQAGSDHLPDAIRWAADHGAKIINMSLGGMRYPDQDSSPCPDDEQSAITYAISKGALVVAAGGNAGQSASPVEDPAVCLGVVSVGSVDRSNNVAPFSSRHPYLTLTAPGVNIASLSRVPGTVYNGGGTSQSTAIVSAALALIWSKFPTLTAQQVLSKALSSLDHGSATRDPGYGFGIINPARAIASGDPAAPNVVFDSVAPFVQRLTNQASEAQVKVPPATFQKTVPGVFVVGEAPSAVTASVVRSMLVAVGGALVLLILVVFGYRSHRRRTAFAQTTTAALAFAPTATATAPATRTAPPSPAPALAAPSVAVPSVAVPSVAARESESVDSARSTPSAVPAGVVGVVEAPDPFADSGQAQTWQDVVIEEPQRDGPDFDETTAADEVGTADQVGPAGERDRPADDADEV